MLGNAVGPVILYVLGAAVALGFSALAAWGGNLADLGRHVSVWQAFGLSVMVFAAAGVLALTRAFYRTFELPRVTTDEFAEETEPAEEEEELEPEEFRPVVLYRPNRAQRRRRRG